MRLEHDSKHNALRLLLDDGAVEPVAQATLAGVVDVAANGRLVGIELRTGQTAEAARRLLRRWIEDPVAGEFVSIDSDGTAYIELTAGEPDEGSRSSAVELFVELTAGKEMMAVSIPRHGAGYEISYPSGNR